MPHLHPDRDSDRRSPGESVYRTMFEKSGVPTIVVEDDATISGANAAFAALTGYSKEELEGGMKWTEFFTDSMLGTMAEYSRLLDPSAAAVPKAFDATLVTRNGSTRFARMTVSSIPGTDRSFATMIDITDKVLTEEELREHESSFGPYQDLPTILNAIPWMLLIVSRDLRILWCNRKAAEVKDTTPSRMLGKFCYEVFHGRPDPCDDCIVLRCFSSGQVESGRVTTGNGMVIDTTAFPVKDEHGNVISVIDTAEDATEKIRMEAEAIRSAHLASIGELAAGVAHEINNPINGIINYAQIMINRGAPGRPEHDMAVRIVKEGTRISGIVRSLLSFSRQNREERHPVSVAGIITETLALTGAQLRRNGVDLMVTVPDGLPDILANAQQIQQVFLNLFSNALYALNEKFAGPHPDKRITVTATVLKDGAHVRISFLDTGKGIHEDNLKKTILPFFTTKPAGKGTGLGLSISHGIITDHGGKLSIESIEGEYTEIVIDLPTVKGMQ